MNDEDMKSGIIINNDGICPYCNSNKTSLKENYWNYYRYKCDNCHKYFKVIE